MGSGHAESEGVIVSGDVLIGWGARAAAIVFSLLNTRLLLDLLGADAYAAFSILVSLGPWFVLLALGIPNATQNLISELRANGSEFAAIRQTALNATVLGVIAFIPLAGVVAFLLQRFVLVEFPVASAGAIFLMCLGLCLNGLATVFYQVLYASHRGVWPNAMPAVLAIATTLCLLTLHHFERHELAWAAAAFSAPALLTFALTGSLAGALRPATIDWSILRHLIKLGRPFLLFATISTGALSLDYVVMARILNADQIVQYNLASKLFSVFLSVHAVLLASSWSSLSDLYFRGDYQAMRAKLMRLLFTGAAVTFVPALLVGLNIEWIVNLIGGKNAVVPSRSLIFAWWLYLLFRIWSDTFSVANMCCNQLTTMNVYISIQAALSIGAQWWLGLRYGATGIALGIVLSFAATSVWILPLRYFQLTRTALIPR